MFSLKPLKIVVCHISHSVSCKIWQSLKMMERHDAKHWNSSSWSIKCVPVYCWMSLFTFLRRIEPVQPHGSPQRTDVPGTDGGSSCITHESPTTNEPELRPSGEAGQGTVGLKNKCRRVPRLCQAKHYEAGVWAFGMYSLVLNIAQCLYIYF